MNATSRNAILHVDVSAICYRVAFSGAPEFENNNGRRAHIAWGFLRWLCEIRRDVGPAAFTFCFDARRNKRTKLLPEYKGNRSKPDPRRDAVRKDVIEQRNWLRKELLPAMGFRNVVMAKGYEADDVIGAMTHRSARQYEKFQHIVATSDHDMYQLLSPHCSLWDIREHRLFGFHEFTNRYEIEPWQWADVKAIAGCSSDNVPGIPGVGEKTAVRFLRDELPEKRRQKILSQRKLVVRNRKLVTLPFKDCPEHKIRKDKVTKPLFRNVCLSNGLKHVGVW